MANGRIELVVAAAFLAVLLGKAAAQTDCVIPNTSLLVACTPYLQVATLEDPGEVCCNELRSYDPLGSAQGVQCFCTFINSPLVGSKQRAFSLLEACDFQRIPALTC